MALIVYTHAAKNVTTAGTRVQIDTEKRPCTTIVLQAKNSNTGLIYVGDSSVAASNGLELKAGESLSITGDNRNEGQSDEVVLADLWIDAAVNGEGVKVAYYKKRDNGIL